MASDPAALADRIDRALDLYIQGARMLRAQHPRPVEYAVLADAMRNVAEELRCARASAEALAAADQGGYDRAMTEVAAALDAEDKDRRGHLRIAG